MTKKELMVFKELEPKHYFRNYFVRFPLLNEDVGLLELINRINQISYVLDSLEISFVKPHQEKLRVIKKLFGKEIYQSKISLDKENVSATIKARKRR